MIDPKFTIDPQLKLDPEDSSSSKKEPKMKWESNLFDVSNLISKPNQPEPEATKIATVEAPMAAQTSDKEALLQELLLAKDKTIAAMSETIVLQRKLLDQLDSNSK